MSDSAPAISLDEVIALNDEIAALAQAGVPVHVGMGGSSPDRLADISGRLANRVSGGASIEQALEAERESLPRIYRFVLEAGIKAGRLPQAVESLASYSRTLLDVRRRIALAMIYPAVVVITAYYLFWYFTGQVIPELMEMSMLGSFEHSDWTRGVLSVFHAVETVRHIPPLALALLLAWWMISSRMTAGPGGFVGTGLRWLPGMRKTIHGLQLASFSELVAILLDHNAQPAEAFKLAAESSGDASLIADADRIAAAVYRGETISHATQSAVSLPPFLRWMVRSAGDQPGSLAASFRQLAAIYRNRTVSRSEWFNGVFPVVLTVLVGGGAVLIYALALFLPVTEMLKFLSAP